MGNIKNASRLDLSHKELDEIPEFVFQCRNLQFLNLSNNKLREIPANISDLKRLKVLDLSNNHIKHILSKTFDLQGLQVLNLNYNQLRGLPKQIEKLTRLKKLFVNANQLESLPDEINKLREITHLGVSDNKFNKFPAVIEDLQSLTHLWIGRNDFETIPIENISQKLKNLKGLYVFNTRRLFISNNIASSSLMHSKGNSLNSLKLLTYMAPNIKSNLEHQDSVEKSKTIFISYSHKDVEYKNEVEVTLKGLKNTFPELEFEFWADDKIKAGDKWQEEISTALNKSAVAILIASRNFIASDFIMKTEVPSILKNAENKGVLVLTVVAGESMLSKSPIGQFQWINDPHKPLKSLNQHEQDTVYNKLASRIAEYFNK